MAQYTCWTEAAMNRGGDAALRHDGANLAEAAPLHPDAVGAIVRTHWAETFWEEHRRRGRAAVLRRLVRSQRLRR